MKASEPYDRLHLRILKTDRIRYLLAKTSVKTTIPGHSMTSETIWSTRKKGDDLKRMPALNLNRGQIQS